MTYSIGSLCATSALHISLTPQLASRLLYAGRRGLDRLTSVVVQNHEFRSVFHILATEPRRHVLRLLHMRVCMRRLSKSNTEVLLSELTVE